MISHKSQAAEHEGRNLWLLTLPRHLSLITAFLIYFERGPTQYRTVPLEAPAVRSVLSLGHYARLELDAET